MSQFAVSIHPFAAEVLFIDPGDVPRCTAAMQALGCDIELDPAASDPGRPTVYGWVIGRTAFSERGIADWLGSILDPLGGSVDICGYGYRPASWNGTIIGEAAA
jgi:hypothetical protein